MEKKSNKIDFDAILTIQTEMLIESRRLNQLTAWLIALTVALINISMVTGSESHDQHKPHQTRDDCPFDLFISSILNGLTMGIVPRRITGPLKR